MNELEGATARPPEGAMTATAGEFAALWNSWDEQQREHVWQQIRADRDAAMQAVIRDLVLVPRESLYRPTPDDELRAVGERMVAQARRWVERENERSDREAHDDLVRELILAATS